MLNFVEFKLALSEDNGPGWLNVYIDRNASYWTQRGGGLGTSMFMKLESDHPYTDFIENMVSNSLLSQQEFESEYEAGGVELAQLLPLAQTEFYKRLTSKESKEAADKLFEASPNNLGDSFSDDSV